MTWDWERLGDIVRRLKLPAGEYAVGRVGYGLSRDRASTADRVDLLVTETGWRRLKERGWHERSGGTLLRHPNEHTLTARVVALADVRHEIVDVDGLPVVAVEPDPVVAQPETWRQWVSTATTGAVMTIVIGVVVYGFAVFFPTPDSSTIWQHLTFETTEVQATVERSTELGTCNGVQAYDRSPRIDVTLAWIEDGQERTGSFTGCGASVDSPQDIWVTSKGEIASQQSPWVDHFWPAIVAAIAPFSFFVMPPVERLRGHWRRRRRG